ncbi:MAG: hypothetical protein ACHQ5A_14325 [Opitutales bacterium]
MPDDLFDRLNASAAPSTPGQEIALGSPAYRQRQARQEAERALLRAEENRVFLDQRQPAPGPGPGPRRETPAAREERIREARKQLASIRAYLHGLT